MSDFGSAIRKIHGQGFTGATTLVGTLTKIYYHLGQFQACNLLLYGAWRGAGPPMKIVFGLGGEILRSTCAQGHGRNGTQALFTLFKCCGW